MFYFLLSSTHPAPVQSLLERTNKLTKDQDFAFIPTRKFGVWNYVTDYEEFLESIAVRDINLIGPKNYLNRVDDNRKVYAIPDSTGIEYNQDEVFLFGDVKVFTP